MVSERSVDTGHRTVRYLEAGAGWPVVLLHAFPLSSDMWRPQLDRAPDGWRLLAPDLKGLGPAGGTPASSLDDMAGDLVAWLEALRIESATIGGSSMGGYLTFALFRLAPERFDAVVLANTRATADSEEARAARDRMSELVRSSGPGAVADQMLPKLLGDTSRRSRPELAPLVRTLIERNSVAGIDGAIQAMKGRPDSRDLLAGLGRPALIVAGGEDAIIAPAEGEAMQRQLPRSQLVVLPGAGHLSNLEAPDDFSAALENFLRANL
jgi:pimeloyl-ACP methyl ester carboxylesterase